jgi:hypothetical protein
MYLYLGGWKNNSHFGQAVVGQELFRQINGRIW